MAVTITSKTLDGKQHRIKMDKTGPDKGTVEITTWQSGQDPQTTPGSKDSYDVDHIKASQDGSKLVCQTHFLISINIEVTVHAAAPPQAPFVRIVISGGNPSDYPVSANDESKLKQFVVAGQFPVIA
jgi:hypothetical protein